MSQFSSLFSSSCFGAHRSRRARQYPSRHRIKPEFGPPRQSASSVSTRPRIAFVSRRIVTCGKRCKLLKLSAPMPIRLGNGCPNTVKLAGRGAKSNPFLLTGQTATLAKRQHPDMAGEIAAHRRTGRIRLPAVLGGKAPATAAFLAGPDLQRQQPARRQQRPGAGGDVAIGIKSVRPAVERLAADRDRGLPARGGQARRWGCRADWRRSGRSGPPIPLHQSARTKRPLGDAVAQRRWRAPRRARRRDRSVPVPRARAVRPAASPGWRPTRCRDRGCRARRGFWKWVRAKASARSTSVSVSGRGSRLAGPMVKTRP
jgi:hypothetical protein